MKNPPEKWKVRSQKSERIFQEISGIKPLFFIGCSPTEAAREAAAKLAQAEEVGRWGMGKMGR